MLMAFAKEVRFAPILPHEGRNIHPNPAKSSSCTAQG